MQLVISTEAPSFFFPEKIRLNRVVRRAAGYVAMLLICMSAHAALYIGGSPTTSVAEGKSYSF